MLSGGGTSLGFISYVPFIQPGKAFDYIGPVAFVGILSE